MRYLLIPFALLFQLAVYLRKFIYYFGFIKQIQVSAKVISIGNISVGGTGKTPLIIFLAKLLHKSKISTVIVSSGYKRKIKNTAIYYPNIHNFEDDNLIDKFGDEATTYILNNPQISVVVDSKKWRAVQIAQNEFNPQVILLDDGFQHWKLKRDLDFVIIDERTNNSLNLLLPFTRLRENFASLKRANLILKRDIKELNKNILNLKIDTISIETKQLGFFEYIDNHYLQIDTMDIGKSISISSIALPDKFHNFVLSKGIDIADSLSFPDHFAYTFLDVENICTKCNQIGALCVITTEKDYTKLKSFSHVFKQHNLQLLISRIDIEVTDNFELFKNKFKRIGINIA